MDEVYIEEDKTILDAMRQVDRNVKITKEFFWRQLQMAISVGSY